MMGSYIMEIVGLIILTMLISIIIPSGEIRKYILGVMSLITLCVIISPLPNIFSNDDILNVDAIDFEMDNSFLDDVTLSSDKTLKKNIENYLCKEGIIGEVSIVKKTRNKNEIDYINVILQEVELSDKDKNIIISKVGNDILEMFDLSCEVRVFYERQNEA